MSGWIKLHRSLSEWAFKQSPKHLAVWIELLMQASHDGNEFYFNDRLVKLEKGQLITGRHSLSAKTGLSEQSVRTILKDLEINQQINQQKTNKYTIISICNWDKYQLDNQQINQQVTSNQPAGNQQVTTIKNAKNEKKSIYNINISIPKEVYKEILIDPLLCNGDREFLLTCCNEMQDWSTSKGEKRIEWSAALRNWIRRAKKDRNYKPKTKSLLEIAEELDRQDAEALSNKKDLIN